MEAVGVKNRNDFNGIFFMVVDPKSNTGGHCDYITLPEVAELLVAVLGPAASSRW